MNKNTRWALAIVGVVIIIAAGVYIASNKDDTSATPTDTPATESTARTGGSTAATGTTGAAPSGGGGATSSGGATPQDGRSSDENGSGGASPDESETGGASIGAATVPTLRAGKVTKITTDKGDIVRFKVKSSTDEVVHVHGYDREVTVPAGRTVTVRFRANLDGVFEIEFHESGEKIGTLTVNP